MLGKYAHIAPMFMTNEDNPEIMIYDFNKRDYNIGTADAPYSYPVRCTYVSEDVITNSSREYRHYTYKHDDGYASYGDEIEMAEGIGMIKSINGFNQCLFFLPFSNGERSQMTPLVLRYVTDKDHNIIYEQEGGTKLWDEMSGVTPTVHDSGRAERYNLQGLKVDTPTTPGIYIRLDGHSSRKIMVK